MRGLILETIEDGLAEIGIEIDAEPLSRLADAVAMTVEMDRELSSYGRPSGADLVKAQVDQAVSAARNDAAHERSRLEHSLKEMTENRNDWRRAFYDLQRERARA